MKSLFSVFTLGIAAILCTQAGFAAKAVDLSGQSAATFATFFHTSSGLRGSQSGIAVKESSRSTDFNQTAHIRVHQTYQGYPVWGSDAVVHMPKGVPATFAAIQNASVNKNITMNGEFYENIAGDLAGAPAYIFNQMQADKALAAAIKNYETSTGAHFTVSNSAVNLLVFVDEKNQAHWAFKVSFTTSRINGMPAKPVYLMDAVTFAVYEHWNNLKTAGVQVPAGGVGGNGRMGKMIYDGLALPNHRPVLMIERGEATRQCYLRNDSVVIRDARYHNEIPSFRCEKPDPQHNNIYWNTIDDGVNGGYSPNNDGLYSDKVVRDMYMTWFNIPMLVKDGKPMQVVFYVHDQLQEQNAYYEDGKMVFGDGDGESYPVVAPSVVAHEMSHGFTEQHAGLNYYGQSGGIDESFSDMADKSVEYFMYGTNNWDIDAELLKDGGKMLRYMDEPTKDCAGKKEGEPCSISHFKNYKRSTDVHHSSGIFNKAFYLIASKWNTRKAFEVMVQANRHYWTANSNFEKAACGIIKATRDYKYDEQTVIDAMRAVGVSTSKCK